MQGLDGQSGPATKSAVVRYQAAYGLTAAVSPDPATFAKRYALQDDDRLRVIGGVSDGAS